MRGPPKNVRTLTLENPAQRARSFIHASFVISHLHQAPEPRSKQARPNNSWQMFTDVRNHRRQTPKLPRLLSLSVGRKTPNDLRNARLWYEPPQQRRTAVFGERRAGVINGDSHA